MLIAKAAICQPFQVDELAPNRTNFVGSIVKGIPTAISEFYAFNENNGGVLTNAHGIDPNGLVLQFSGLDIHPDAFGKIDGSMFSFEGYSPSFTYTPNYPTGAGYVGDAWFRFYVDNGFAQNTNVYDFLVYNTNLPSITCSGLSYTGAICNFQFPAYGIDYGSNYFFSIYDQQNHFSNTYYWNESLSRWSVILNPNLYPNSFDNFSNGAGSIIFPSALTNINICVALTVSNGVAPCVTYSSNLYMIVLTNSITTADLVGINNNLFIISSNPTNGYITNFNSSSGQFTYVETNNSATYDQFGYCATNTDGRGCSSCSTVGIDIITEAEITCGSCFPVPPFNGGIVTGTVWFNVGTPNEDVCIYYTNEVCHLTTNCAISDQNGNVSFFILLCPGDTNVCIASLATIDYLCYPTQVTVAGAGKAPGYLDPNGIYYFQSLGGITYPLNVTLTNSNPLAYGQVWMLYNGSGGNIVPQNCFSPALTNNAQFAMIIDSSSAVESVLTNYVFIPNTPCLYPLGQENQMIGWDYPVNCTSPSAYPPPAPCCVTIQAVQSITQTNPICP